jgi:hypothetical protein
VDIENFNPLARLFFGDVPLAVARSLRAEPDAWTRDSDRYRHLGKTYRLIHAEGVEVWVSNGSWGVDVQAARAKKWGDVTILSLLRLSPGHWLIWCAAKAWMRSRRHDFRPNFRPIIDALSSKASRP